MLEPASAARRRVFVTGVGLISPHGGEPEEVFERLYAGESAIRKVHSGTTEFGADALLARAECDPAGVIPKTQLLLMDRVSQMAVVAAHRALRAAKLLVEDRGPSTAGVYIGCGLGGSNAIQEAYRSYYERHIRKVKPSTVPLIMTNAPASHISMRYRILGPSLTYSIACSSSAVAIGEAFRAIRDGYLDCALAGGTESMLNDGALVAWDGLGVLAKEHADGAAASSRPFSKDRTGFVLGEGSAAIVLETQEAMRARGAQPIAEVVGYGASSDAHNLTQPAVDGQVRAMRAALADAGLQPERVGYINAHATATPAGDKIEIDAIKQTFGDHARRLAVSATKSMHGHLVGAAGALEFAITVLALNKRRLPPTANLTMPDPECDLDCVPCVGRQAPNLEYALSNSFAFGGSNAVLVARRA
ncbi:MAG TPA: beta-ketoacyl-[acyl-carrier-protein] synthase family protein [Burkholderiales bacterium]|nr:beta-ketoacyl-[acyl-carrier-protein] synthase family protein [Burkholderiales bacterium]